MYMFDCLIFMSIFILNTNFQENPNVFGLKNKLGQKKKYIYVYSYVY